MALVPPASDVEPGEVGQALTEGALLGLYTLKKYKTVAENEDKDNLRELSILASGSTTTTRPGKRRATRSDPR